jgi:hypothetical protein
MQAVKTPSPAQPQHPLSPEVPFPQSQQQQAGPEDPYLHGVGRVMHYQRRLCVEWDGIAEELRGVTGLDDIMRIDLFRLTRCLEDIMRRDLFGLTRCPPAWGADNGTDGRANGWTTDGWDMQAD